jgi:hypothetical protein
MKTVRAILPTGLVFFLLSTDVSFTGFVATYRCQLTMTNSPGSTPDIGHKAVMAPNVAHCCIVSRMRCLQSKETTLMDCQIFLHKLYRCRWGPF